MLNKKYIEFDIVASGLNKETEPNWMAPFDLDHPYLKRDRELIKEFKDKIEDVLSSQFPEVKMLFVYEEAAQLYFKGITDERLELLIKGIKAMFPFASCGELYSDLEEEMMEPIIVAKIQGDGYVEN